MGWALLGVSIMTACGATSLVRSDDDDDSTAGTDSGDDGNPAQGGGSGTGSAAGTTSTGGRVSCAAPLPDVDCDYRTALGAPGTSGYCFKGGCHNATTAAGALDLTPDDHLAARLLDVPAKHQLTCPGNVPCDPAQATCAACVECPIGALLIDTANPELSWILKTMEPFIPGTTTGTLSLGCGDAMPTFNTTGTATYTQTHKDCLREFFLALAATPGDWPCVPN
jgi:hypothetical protein